MSTIPIATAPCPAWCAEPDPTDPHCHRRDAGTTLIAESGEPHIAEVEVWWHESEPAPLAWLCVDRGDGVGMSAGEARSVAATLLYAAEVIAPAGGAR